MSHPAPELTNNEPTWVDGPQPDQEKQDAVGDGLVGLLATVLAIAVGEVGYTEGDNMANKYGKWASHDNTPWSGHFLSWVGHKASATEVFPVEASTSARLAWHRKRGECLSGAEAPQAGDVAFLHDPETDRMAHAGLVVRQLQDGRVALIEGSAMRRGGTEPGRVALIHRAWLAPAGARDDLHIAGYARPVYSG